ncbi:MAG: serine hydrolase domain-containing protein [Bacteroidota bacterium]
MKSRLISLWDSLGSFSIYILLFFLWSGCGQAFNKDEYSPFPPQNQAQLQDVFQTANEEVGLPGIIVVSLNSGKIEHVFSSGMRNDTAKIDEHTVFEAASLSKTICTYLIHRLISRAHPSWLDSSVAECLERYPPRTEAPGKSWDKLLSRSDSMAYHLALSVTPRQLLSHTSGYGGYSPNGEVRIIEPGQFEYSEDGFLLVQGLLEAFTSQNLEELAQSELFSPLDLQSTSFVWNPDLDALSADAYLEHMEGRRSIRHFSEPLANGTLLTSPIEFAKILEALWSDKEVMDLICSHRVSMNTEEESLTWGLGCGRERNEESEWLWQWGANWEYRSYYALDVQTGDGLVLFANGRLAYEYFPHFWRAAVGTPAPVSAHMH